MYSCSRHIFGKKLTIEANCAVKCKLTGSGRISKSVNILHFCLEASFLNTHLWSLSCPNSTFNYSYPSGRNERECVLLHSAFVIAGEDTTCSSAVSNILAEPCMFTQSLYLQDHNSNKTYIPTSTPESNPHTKITWKYAPALTWKIPHTSKGHTATNT